jgi:hypothetical protein
MRTEFYQQLLNSIDKVPTVGLDEKNSKSDIIMKVVDEIRKHKDDYSVVWKKGKWVVSANNTDGKQKQKR